VISKAVIEEFARRYLKNPAVLWISESGAKVVARDDELATQLKLKISADRNLPDIILVDLGCGATPKLTPLTTRKLTPSWTLVKEGIWTTSTPIWLTCLTRRRTNRM